MQKTHNVGVLQLLDYISCAGSNIARAFIWIYGQGRGHRLLALAWYALCSRAPLQEIEQWQLSHQQHCADELSLTDCEELLKEAGSDPDTMQRFFKYRNTHLHLEGNQGLLVELPELKLLMLCSMEHQQPLSFAQLSDELPRDAALEKAKEELSKMFFTGRLKGIITDDASAGRLMQQSRDFVLQQLDWLKSAPVDEAFAARLRGQIFICFAALCLYLAFEHKLNLVRKNALFDYRMMVKISGGRETALSAALKDLLAWLEPMDAHRILLWFDSLKSANPDLKAGRERLSPESLSRDVLFLRYLGYSEWIEQNPNRLLIN